MNIKTKKELIIIATGSVAAEITSYIEDSSLSEILTIKGYLEYDDNIEKYYNRFDFRAPILGDIDSYLPQENDYFVLGVANIAFREKVITILKAKGAKFYTLIHPTSVISSSAIIGEGCVIAPFVTIGPYVQLGNFNHLTSYSFISHECKVGDNNVFSTAGICGRVEIGNNNMFYIRSTVIPDIKIGNNITIGAGSVLMKNVKDSQIYFGNPAKKFVLL